MKPDMEEETTVLNLRDMPKDLIAKLKAVATLEHASLKDYVTALLEHHVADLEKNGLLPKGKGSTMDEHAPECGTTKDHAGGASDRRTARGDAEEFGSARNRNTTRYQKGTTSKFYPHSPRAEDLEKRILDLQQLAKIPEPEFERRLAKASEHPGPPMLE